MALQQKPAAPLDAWRGLPSTQFGFGEREKNTLSVDFGGRNPSRRLRRQRGARRTIRRDRRFLGRVDTGKAE